MIDINEIEGYPDKVENLSGEAFVYVLKLFDNHFYVGVTKHPKRRIVSHARGEAVSPDWVKMYPPVEIQSVHAFDSRDRAMEQERIITLELSSKHSAGRVRGSKWTDVDDKPPTDQV
ncbi:GIY-YIG nuclease family protein [Halobaculum sp. MBLA0147]|uniref:GIY-YIG nuclease family protein n=1 Tax=Halobaculum sp. MBLA0147 TaxID=3079934 RepID=UPI0035264F02